MPPTRRGDSSRTDKYAFHDRDKKFCSRCIRFNFDNALLALSLYRDGGDWTSGKIAMRSPRTEPSQSSLATWMATVVTPNPSILGWRMSSWTFSVVGLTFTTFDVCEGVVPPPPGATRVPSRRYRG